MYVNSMSLSYTVRWQVKLPKDRKLANWRLNDIVYSHYINGVGMNDSFLFHSNFASWSDYEGAILSTQQQLLSIFPGQEKETHSQTSSPFVIGSCKNHENLIFNEPLIYKQILPYHTNTRFEYFQ